MNLLKTEKMKKPNENTNLQVRKNTRENEEMMDVVRQMRSQGWQVEVCDTPVPYFTDGVSAGYPRECGDYDGEMMALPGTMGGCITITVTGDSMENANIHDGDVVICRFCGRPDEGDVVVARLEDQFVVKAYYKDEHGRQWLLPMNPKYRAIALDDYPECHIVGTVKMKCELQHRISSHELRKALDLPVEEAPQPPTDEQVRRAVAKVLPLLKQRRRWYSVYRALVDVKYIHYHDYAGFCSRIDALFPDNDFGLSPTYIGRMGIDCFDKPVVCWKAEKAPVNESCFKGYLLIAKTVLEEVREGKAPFTHGAAMG